MADELPVIGRDDVTLLFDWDHYDGPLSGALTWEGRRYWFTIVGEDIFSGMREVVDLTAEQWALIDDLHALFCQHVGTHWNRDPGTGFRHTQGHHQAGQHQPDLYFEDPRVKAWQDPSGTVVAMLRLYEEGSP